MTSRRLRRLERGQATVELALCLPLIMLAMLLVVQVGLVVRDQIRTVHAAREAARESAVSPDAGVVTAAALSSSALDATRTSVQIAGRGEAGSRVTVRVSYQSATDVPLVGFLLPDPVLHAEATMRVEG